MRCCRGLQRHVNAHIHGCGRIYTHDIHLECRTGRREGAGREYPMREKKRAEDRRRLIALMSE